MSDLNSIIRQRGSLKARLTNFGKYLEGIIARLESNANSGASLSDTDTNELVARLNKVRLIESEFEEVQSRIECVVEECELQVQYDERESFEKSYYSLTSKAKAIIDAQQNQQNVDNESVISNNSAASGCSLTSHRASNRLKLPTIKLLPFSGLYDDWLEYREMFESLIHRRDDIDNVEKFHYLRSTLQGDAIQVIKAIEFTAANYERAWQPLCDRYNNERILVNNHVKALFNMEPITKESSVKLRKLIDTISKHLQALNSLGQPTESWDTLVIHIVSAKVDNTTAREWEECKASNQLPTLEDLKSFLKGRADLLETLESRHADKVHFKGQHSKSKSFLTSSKQCVICNGEHAIYNCEKLVQMPRKQRFDSVRKLKLCINCLRPGHYSGSCKARPCKKCEQKHNTLLHDSSSLDMAQETTSVEKSAKQSCPEKDPPLAMFSSSSYSKQTHALLSTALVQVIDKNGSIVECRALLDSGSQPNLVSERLCDRLGLTKTKLNIALSGVGDTALSVEHKVLFKVHSRINNYQLELSCLVVPKIGDNIPSIPFNQNKLNIPHNIILADPKFCTPDKVDILIGSNHFWDLIAIGQRRLGSNMPILQKTRFGWIVSGPLTLSKEYSLQVSCNFSQTELHNQMQKFWEVEEVGSVSKVLSNEERECENLFTKTTVQLADGRFMVQIPLKIDPSQLGESEQAAVKRLHGIEKRFYKDGYLAQQYKGFMAEYRQLGHMSQVEGIKSHSVSYFIPHHAVIKSDSLTTKVRVVFDASSKSSSGYSLNDLQMVGPTIQQDLMSIVLRFRKHKIALTADITKMYRQVLIVPDQRSLQTILWREDSSAPMQPYVLNTVTYGTASAAFLAIRCLHQTAYNNAQKYPMSSKIVLSDLYVDDLLTGAETIERARIIKAEVSEILESGCFPLRKWTSNEPTVFDMEAMSSPLDILIIGKDEKTKTLGLTWNPNADTFEFSMNVGDSRSFTKRKILSLMSQIFDPMGLLAPLTVTAKVILQKLWQSKADWDESLPHSIFTEWSSFYNDLRRLNQISVPRRILIDDPVRIELHGFSDASVTAYGACIYVRSLNRENEVNIALLCAKSKVAPLKPLTVPRLELCGALVLARLMEKAITALDMRIDEISYWCDSTVVLGQLRKPPGTFQTFVSNRLAEIQTLTNPLAWRHVQTDDNPADLLSRGLRPSQMQSCTFWFNGPHWLSNPNLEYVEPALEADNLPEMRKTCTSFTVTSCISFPLFRRFSSLPKILRITAYYLRFIESKSKLGSLIVSELNNSLLFIVKLSQRESFPEEYNCLLNDRSISSKGRLLNLNPFMHSDNTIRVGGRLHRSKFDFEKRHPIVLDGKHPLAKLIFEDEHKRLLHAGPQLLLASLRERFWTLSGRNLAKQVVHNCMKCFKTKPKFTQPMMGNLPPERITPSHPFNITGVDYAGPLLIKDRKGRGCKINKCYICLFICFSTKCIHLEIVTSLTTETFLAALKRFVSRRGRPHIYSDNGTNFVGARSELKELGVFLKDNQGLLENAFIEQSLSWHFIPAHSPHFGGLWEAGIKSTKAHLKRVAGNQSFTFEELYTLIVQIEAVLNSRPLSPLSADPNDPSPLTPSHFLIGRAVTSLPEVTIPETTPENRLSVYQRIEQARQSFWKRWSLEYVSELQQRVKWRKHHVDLQLGTLVLIKDSNLPPMKWSLGRVVEIHPGSDRITRVVTLKTSKGLVKRAVGNLCPLPSGECV